MTEDTPEIKPCPFCGSDAGKLSADFYSECYGYTDRDQVECGKCYATGPIAEGEQEAIKAWNEAKR